MKKIYTLFATFILVLAGTSLFPTAKVVAAECGGPVPPTPKKFTAVSGPAAGQVTLYWDEAAYANRYAVAYGTESGKYVYGANNIGGKEARSYTVKALTPGVRYYFRLAAARDCSSSGFSSEVSAVAGGEAVGAPVTSGVTVAPVIPVTAVPAQVVISGPVGKQGLTATAGSGVGEVTLGWQHADNADNYHLMYGTTPGKYQYGALNIGKVTGFTVRFLAPGTTYYFALVPLLDNKPLYTTAYVAGRAGAPVEVVVTSRENLIEPPPPPPVVSAAPTEGVSLDEEQSPPEEVKGVSEEAPPEEAPAETSSTEEAPAE